MVAKAEEDDCSLTPHIMSDSSMNSLFPNAPRHVSLSPSLRRNNLSVSLPPCVLTLYQSLSLSLSLSAMCVCARVCVYVYVCVPVCNKMKIEGCRHIDRDKLHEVETLGGLSLELSLCVLSLELSLCRLSLELSLCRLSLELSLCRLSLELSLCVRVRAHTCGCVPVY